MKLLKDSGNYTLLTPRPFLKEQLRIIEQAGRTCYQSFNGEITDQSATSFIRMLLGRNHESVLEHSLLTVLFSGISRSCTHELVRHRLCAFSQESTRYVDYAKKGNATLDLNRFRLRCVTPPHKDERQIVSVDIPKSLYTEDDTWDLQGR